MLDTIVITNRLTTLPTVVHRGVLCCNCHKKGIVILCCHISLPVVHSQCVEYLYIVGAARILSELNQRVQYGTTCALPSPFSPALLTLLLPVARDGTSQDGTDEGGIIGDDGGVDRRRVVTGGDDTGRTCKR